MTLWLPRGEIIVEELEKLAHQMETAAGYQRVRTPHIAKEALYLRSGHLPYYADSRLGVLPHTVQFYDLDGHAPTYDNQNFNFIPGQDNRKPAEELTGSTVATEESPPPPPPPPN